MRTILLVATLVAGYALAQTCIVPAPSAPPKATAFIITLPSDGGTQGCTGHAVVLPNGATPTEYPIGNAKCATVVQMASQAAANDNGWNDGGVP